MARSSRQTGQSIIAVQLPLTIDAESVGSWSPGFALKLGNGVFIRFLTTLKELRKICDGENLRAILSGLRPFYGMPHSPGFNADPGLELDFTAKLLATVLEFPKSVG